MNLCDLDTPSLILDRGRLRANARAMSERVKGLGVELRPHMKTAKSIEVARIASAGNAGGITVSTLKEAEYFHGKGITDITYAVGLAPAKIKRANALAAAGANLKIITDNGVAARAIADEGWGLSVLVEIDCGDERGGMLPAELAVIEVARLLEQSSGVTFMGVLTHAGHSYDCRTAEEMADLAEVERATAVDAADRIRLAGIDCPVVSVGSTPTARFARNLNGVTEVRPGVYMFADLFQAGIGSCGMNDMAVSVLASVIAHRPELDGGKVLIDAGGLSLSKDRSTAALGGDCGYGLLADAKTGALIPGIAVSAVNQEHGHITALAGLSFPFDLLPIGSLVRVFVNHACMTAAAYGAYHVIDDDSGEIAEVWERCNGW